MSDIKFPFSVDGSREVMVRFAQDLVRFPIDVESLQLIEGCPHHMDDRPHNGKPLFLTPGVVLPAKKDVAVTCNANERPFETIGRDPMEFQILALLPHSVNPHAPEIRQESIEGIVQVPFGLTNGCEGIERVRIFGLPAANTMVHASKILYLRCWTPVFHRRFREDSKALINSWCVGNFFLKNTVSIFLHRIV